MGHRTLTPRLVFRALFADSEAFEELRNDDSPFIEGLFLVTLVAALAAALNLIGQVLAWASTPRIAAIKDVVLEALQQQSWWGQIAAEPESMNAFQQIWDAMWRFAPSLFGAPDPASSALNILIWPIGALLSWLFYGLLAHFFGHLLGGAGTVGQTLGTTALAATPLLFRGLGIIPFFVIGGVISTWQLILRYKALRVTHRLSWGRAFWATVLPFAVYLLFWLLLAGIGALVISALVGR